MRGMGDFRKEFVQCFRLISREKILARKYLAKKKSHTEKKKRLKPIILEKTVVRQEKKILSPKIYQKNYFPSQITRTPHPPLKLIKWLAVIVDTSSRSVSVDGQYYSCNCSLCSTVTLEPATPQNVTDNQ